MGNNPANTMGLRILGALVTLLVGQVASAADVNLVDVNRDAPLAEQETSTPQFTDLVATDCGLPGTQQPDRALRLRRR